MKIVSITTLIFQGHPQLYFLFCLYKVFRTLSLSRYFVEFSLKAVYPTIVCENFQTFKVLVFRLLANTFESHKFESRDSYLYSLPPSKTVPQVLITTPRQRETTRFPQAAVFWKIFPSAAGCRGEARKLWKVHCFAKDAL